MDGPSWAGLGVEGPGCRWHLEPWLLGRLSYTWKGCGPTGNVTKMECSSSFHTHTHWAVCARAMLGDLGVASMTILGCDSNKIQPVSVSGLFYPRCLISPPSLVNLKSCPSLRGNCDYRHTNLSNVINCCAKVKAELESWNQLRNIG